ncbi:hypothetical protein ACSVDM_13680 [Nocardia sp. JW2]|uniref:hypothetical protein n=1 Tax=Nocardia sp. JW2 TaxID=3450738 RepID=UPI003F41E686
MTITACVAGLVVGVVSVVEATSPDPMVWSAGWVVLVGLSIWWVYLVIGYAPTTTGGLMLVAVQPLLVFCGFVGEVNNLPERIAWRVSADAMTATAQVCEPAGDPRWIGTFRVDAVRRDSDGACAFAIGQRSDTDGLAYFAPGTNPPDDTQQRKAHTYYQPFDGNWFRYEFAPGYID